MGLIRALRSALPEHAREWVYYGATVQDLSDTWFALVFRALGDIAERDVTRMRDRPVELAAKYRDTPMCGRTHGQPGLPITFGFKAAVWATKSTGTWTVCGASAGAAGSWSSSAGRSAPWNYFSDAPSTCSTASPGARPGRTGNPLAHLARRGGRVHLAAGGDLGHSREDRQRGLPAAAAGNRRAARVLHRRHGRLDHDAAQAQPGNLRAPGHPLPGHPGPGRADHERGGCANTSATGGPGRPSGSSSRKPGCTSRPAWPRAPR